MTQQTELNKQLQDQLFSQRTEHQEILRQLKDAHLLIEKHTESLISATQNEVRKKHSYSYMYFSSCIAVIIITCIIIHFAYM